MRILVIGSGGREHAIVWKLAQSPKVKKIFVIPGNPGMKKYAECVSMSLKDLNKIADFAREQQIDLTVVGPEVPLIEGIADIFAARGLAVFGPSALAAEIEGSKAFSKDLMVKYNIPTAFFKTCYDITSAKAYVEEKGAPIVVKADGLAAGKGVVVAMTKEESFAAIDSMMAEHKFGDAGARVVIEEYMDGEEASVLAFTDGQTVVPMAAAQDHKRVYDGDKGANTGGMGAYAPAPVMTPALLKKCAETILQPIVEALRLEGRLYKGCIYAGLMIKGESIRVVEFNARFGDPETQALLPLLTGDLAEIMLSCAKGTLDPNRVTWSDKSAVCVIMSSGGYPASYGQGFPIVGLGEASKMDNVVVFHAGTSEEKGCIFTAGGRVLGVTAVGDSILQAKELAYRAVDKIHFEKAHFRKDIAWRALQR